MKRILPENHCSRTRISLIVVDNKLMCNSYSKRILGYVNDDEEVPDLDAPDLLNEVQQGLREARSKALSKKETIQIALGNDIQLRTTAKMSGPQVCTKTTNTLIQKLLHQEIIILSAQLVHDNAQNRALTVH